MINAQSRPDHRARYQGKQLLSLMLAICLPAALLYLRLVLALTATETRVTTGQARALVVWSNIALLLFFAAQLICARYIQRMFFAKPGNRAKLIVQYLAVLLFCVLFSWTGAVILEAFGWNVFLRVPH